VDHIKARRAGGTDALDNLRSLCKPHDHAIKTPTGRKAQESRSGFRQFAGTLIGDKGAEPSGKLPEGLIAARGAVRDFLGLRVGPVV